MKNITTFICIVSLLVSATHAFSQTFQRTYGSVDNDKGGQIIVTQDNNYAIAGTNGDGIYLMKTDTLGFTIWQKTYSPPNMQSYYFAYSFQETPDSGFIIAGNTQQTMISNGNICLIRTNSSGDTLWTRQTGSPALSGYYPAVSHEVIITTDGGYAIVGSAEGSSDKNVYFLKTDSVGNLLWAKSFGGTEDDVGYSLKQTNDGGYILAGYTNSFGQGYWDVYLIRLSPSGSLIWTKTYGNNHYEHANHIELTNDNGFMLTGKTYGYGTTGPYDDDLFLMKTDSLGLIEWAFGYGGNEGENGNSVRQTSDGGFISTGFTNSTGAGQEDVKLLKTDSIGNVLWSKAIGGASTEQGNDVIEKNGYYLIAGETRNFSKGLKDLYLIKTDSFGNDSCRQDTAISYKKNLPWTVGTGGTESNGYTPKSNVIVTGNPDTSSYSTCICVPPVANFNSSFIDACGFFYDYSTWASTWFWDFGDGTVSNDENPNHCFPNGTFNVCLTVTNECGTDTWCDSIVASVGINEIPDNKIKMIVAPNPFDNITTVKFENRGNEILQLELVNTLGQSAIHIDNITGNEIQIEKKNLLAGFYFILVKRNGEIAGMEKLVVE